MVGVWCRYKEGDEKIVANGYIVQYGGRAGNRFQIHNYKVDGAYKLVNGGPAVVIDGKDVPFEVGPRARIIIRKQGSKEDLKVGYELHFPSFGSGDTLPPQGYVRYLPPRE